jgi:hypothetical protein
VTPKTLFRLLIVFSFVWLIVAVTVSTLTIPYLPQPLRDYLLQHTPDRPGFIPQSVSKGVVLVISLVVLVISVATIVGMWRFRPWARVLFVVGTAFGLLSQIFASPTVLPGAASFCFSVAEFMQGVTIAIAFLPPVSNLFSPRKV